MRRLRAGDSSAAATIFDLFARRLVALARSRLTQAVQRKEDAEDVVQSALRSFFARHGEGEFAFADPHDLWKLLALITLRKCGGRVDYYRAARRDIGREIAPPAPEDSAAQWEPIAREPTPAEAAMLIEVTENLLRGLGERDRRIVELSLQEASPLAISEQVGCSERTVARVLERVRKSLEA